MATSRIKTSSILQGFPKSRSLLAGNAAYDPTNFESLSTVIVGSGGASDITFSSIPQGYAHLQIRGIARNNFSSNNGITLRMQFNSDTANNYSYHGVGTYQGASAATESFAGASQSFCYVGVVPDSLIASSIFSAHTIDILDYTDTNKFKTVRALGGYDFNGATSGYSYFYLHSSNWRSTNAITSIKLYGASNNFAQYSKFALYGIRD